MISWLKSLLSVKTPNGAVVIEDLKRRQSRIERELEALRVQEVDRYRRRGERRAG